MFTKSTEIYDLIYSTKDYKSEAEKLTSVLRSRFSDTKEILDVACGTGEHHRYLIDQFQIEGFDLNEEFIQIAQSKNPKATYSVADMIDFEFNKKYDAVVCLFSSIGYVKTVANLKRAISCFKKHLKNTGVIVIEPWISPSKWISGRTNMQTYSSPEVKVCRMNTSSVEDHISILDFEYLVGDADGIHHYKEKHKLGLFDHNTMKEVFEELELNCEFVAEGLTNRGLYIGTHKK